jgi:methyl-accepting chemotaxis protein
MKLANMKIGARLGLGFGLIMLLMVAVGLTGYWGVSESTNTTIEMLRGDGTVAEHAAKAQTDVIELRRYEKDLYLNIGDKEKERDYLQKWKVQLEHLNARLADLDKSVILPKDKGAVKTMKTELGHYERGFAKVHDRIVVGQVKTPQEANAAINDYKGEIHQLEKISEEMADEANKRMDEKEPVMVKLARHTSLIVSISILLGIILTLATGFMITRSITFPLQEAVTISNRLAEGDLNMNIEVNRGDEVGHLLTAMQNMVAKLRMIVGEVKSAADNVASGSQQLSSSSEEMSQGATEQAAAAEEASWNR